MPGDKASILTTNEIVFPIPIVLTLTAIKTLHDVWCMDMLQKHRAVTRYNDEIAHVMPIVVRTREDAVIPFSVPESTSIGKHPGKFEAS